MFGLVVAVCAAGVRAVCFQLKGRWYEIDWVDVYAWCLRDDGRSWLSANLQCV